MFIAWTPTYRVAMAENAGMTAIKSAIAARYLGATP
jgi:hypothetical protein